MNTFLSSFFGFINVTFWWGEKNRSSLPHIFDRNGIIYTPSSQAPEPEPPPAAILPRPCPSPTLLCHLGLVHLQLGQQAHKPLERALVSVDPDEVHLGRGPFCSEPALPRSQHARTCGPQCLHDHPGVSRAHTIIPI